MLNAFAINTVLNTEESTTLLDHLHEGDLVYDRETKMCYCVGKNKFSIVIEEELAPCLASKCPKREDCYKYYLARKFPEDKFIVRDLSTEVETVYDEDDNNCGRHICCSKENRYKCFRWDD